MKFSLGPAANTLFVHQMAICLLQFHSKSRSTRRSAVQSFSIARHSSTTGSTIETAALPDNPRMRTVRPFSCEDLFLQLQYLDRARWHFLEDHSFFDIPVGVAVVAWTVQPPPRGYGAIIRTSSANAHDSNCGVITPNMKNAKLLTSS